MLAIPLTHPFVLVALLTTVSLHSRRHPRKGLCRQCGYDLTGNVSGVCPECGTEINVTT